MPKQATVTIVLEYTTDTLENYEGNPVSDGEFAEMLESAIYDDLRNYLMGEPIKNWAKIEITEA